MSDYKATSKGLFKDGKLVKLKFGDQEQIKEIRRYERKVEDMRGSGFVVQFQEIEATIHFDCICGRTISSTATIELGSNLEEFEYKKEKCRDCNEMYDFVINEDEELSVRLLSKQMQDEL